MGDKGRQDLGKADIPSNKGRQEGIEGGHTIQHRHTCGETMGDNRRQGETRGEKTSGRQTHHPTKGNKKGDKGRQGLGNARRDTRGDKTSETRRHHPTQAHMRGDNERQWEAMGDKTLGRARFAPRILSPFQRNLFPLQCRINSLAICSMLNLEAAISTICATFSTVIAAFWSKKLMVSHVELETFFWPESEIFGASNNLGLVQLEVLLGAAVVCAWGWLRVSVSWVGLVIPGRSKVGL